MVELKPGWKLVRFADMVTSAGATRKSRGWNIEEAGVKRYVGLEHLDSNSLAIRRWGDPRDVGENSDLRHFEIGDVLLARRGIDLRKVGRAHFRGVASGHALVFRAIPEVTLPEFLPFFVQSNVFMKRADRRSVGSLSKTVNLSALLKEEFELPPLGEQRRISRALHCSEAVIDSAFCVLKSAEATYLSLLFQLFQKGIGGVQSQPWKNTLFPAHWKWVRLGDCFHFQLGKMSSAKARESEDRTLYIKNNNVQWGRFDFSRLDSMHFSEKEKEKFRLRNGDLLVCEGGEIGRAAIWRSERSNVFYQKAIHRLRPKRKNFSNPFLFHYLRYMAERKLLLGLATGTTILHLPEVNLRNFRLPFPSLKEQSEIAKVADECFSAIERAASRLSKAQAVHAALSCTVLEEE